MNNDDKDSGFVSHLTELRKRLIHSFIFLFIFFIGCYVLFVFMGTAFQLLVMCVWI